MGPSRLSEWRQSRREGRERPRNRVLMDLPIYYCTAKYRIDIVGTVIIVHINNTISHDYLCIIHICVQTVID
jgi:hypothetical protein